MNKTGLATFLPPPSQGTQTIIGCFPGEKFISRFIEHEEDAALNNTPSAIAVASVNDWLQLLISCRKDPHLANATIDVFFRQLFDIHSGDEQDLEFFNKNLPSIVNKLLIVNNLPLISLPSQIASVPNILAVDFDELDTADKEAITSLTQSLSSAEENPSNSFAEFSSYIPLLPPRQLELDSIDLDHKLWGFSTMNFKAPFSQESLIILLSLSSDAVDQCKVSVWQGKQFLAAELEYNLLLFSLQSFDHTKCSKNQVFFRAKAIPQDRSNLKRYLKTCWNIKRPYVKCRCKANSGCNSTILWVDQVIWFMLHHLPSLFKLESPRAQFFAFIAFLGALPLEVRLGVLAFYIFQEQLLDAAKNLSRNAAGSPLLPNIGHTPVAGIIDQILKPSPLLEASKNQFKKNKGTPSYGSSSTLSTKRQMRGSKKYNDIGETTRLLTFED